MQKKVKNDFFPKTSSNWMKLNNIPDDILRRAYDLLPNGYKVEDHYLDEKNNIINLVIRDKRVRYTLRYRGVIKKIPRCVLERRNWSKFGRAAHNNTDITTMDGIRKIETETETETKTHHEDTSQPTLPGEKWTFGGDMFSMIKNIDMPNDSDNNFKLEGLDLLRSERGSMMINDIDLEYCNTNDISDMCSKFGKIRKISIVREKFGKNKGNPTGRVFVDFYSKENMLDAVKKLNGTCIGYTIINVEETRT